MTVPVLHAIVQALKHRLRHGKPMLFHDTGQAPAVDDRGGKGVLLVPDVVSADQHAQFGSDLYVASAM